MKKKKKRPRGKDGKFLTKRQIAARKAAKKRGNPKPKKKKKKKKGTTTMAKKKGGKKKRRRSSTKKAKGRVGPAIAAAGFGYAKRKHAKTVASLPTIEAIGIPLTLGLAAHYAHKSNIGGKWTDSLATGLICVGAYEAGLSEFDTKAIAEKTKTFKQENKVEGDDDDEISGDMDDDDDDDDE